MRSRFPKPNSILISTLGIRRIFAQRHALSYSEQVPVEQLVHSLCDQKQGYTQFGGLRPFGVSFLFAGWYDLNKVATTPWVSFMPFLTFLAGIRTAAFNFIKATLLAIMRAGQQGDSLLGCVELFDTRKKSADVNLIVYFLFLTLRPQQLVQTVKLRIPFLKLTILKI